MPIYSEKVKRLALQMPRRKKFPKRKFKKLVKVKTRRKGTLTHNLKTATTGSFGTMSQKELNELMERKKRK